jgi:hypothetical protein
VETFNGIGDFPRWRYRGQLANTLDRHQGAQNDLPERRAQLFENECAFLFPFPAVVHLPIWKAYSGIKSTEPLDVQDACFLVLRSCELHGFLVAYPID